MFDKLIARKLRIEEDRTKTFTHEADGVKLEFKRLTNEQIVAALNEMRGQSSMDGIYTVSRKLIYDSCEQLRDPKLHKALEIIDPYDTVDALFEIFEILDLGERIMEFNGFDGLEDEIKN